MPTIEARPVSPGSIASAATAPTTATLTIAFSASKIRFGPSRLLHAR